MTKKIITLTMTLLLTAGIATQAQEGNNAKYGNPAKGNTKNIAFPSSDIQFWTGTGTNETVVIVGWDDEPGSNDTALAWGVRYNGSISAKDAIDSIATHDSRFTYTMSGPLMTDINFNDGVINPQSSVNYWCYNVNGSFAPDVYENVYITDGDIIEISSSCYFSLTTATAVSNPNPAPIDTNATIAPEDITFWVGEGNFDIIFVINWPDSALAWGYHFSARSTNVQQVMNAIAEADPRLQYVTGTYGIDDILFIENGDTLRKAAYSWWEHTLNGQLSAGLGQQLNAGDFSRWADPTSGVVVDSTYDTVYHYWMYTYAYPQRIYPAHNPDTLGVGPFCGAVGTEGCTAVPCDDPRIKGWATGCTLVRGSQNLSDSTAPVVTYGTEQDAIGPATNNTMDVVSLGDGGMATLTFDQPGINGITNGDGYDFAVYENSFNDSFLELAFVEVSTDGIRYVRFPATSLTQTNRQIGGTGSVDPTFIDNLAGKYRVGYGTPFDLEELRDSAGIDINNINYVRIIDVVGSIDPLLGSYDAYGHIVNDPFPTVSYSAGFDLDGVAVLNANTVGIDNADATALRLYPNPADSRVLLTGAGDADAILYDMTGRQVLATHLRGGRAEINTAALPAGVYMLRLGVHTQKLVIKH